MRSQRCSRARLAASVLALVCAVAAPREAAAFCGFYVSGADTKLFNNATQVVLLRDGTRTVLSMQNDYEGPPEGFALVIPVPVVLQKENVKTLPKEVFDRVDKMGAPRLVEYWEQDPCGGGGGYGFGIGAARRSRGSGGGGMAERKADLGVTVEASFDVGEYEIVILSAKDSSGLETWLAQEEYKVPAGSEPYLRPYVQSGSKFFVARVDPKRVKFEGGHAQLSPLRFHYDSNDFSLPVRLGLVNSRGAQDLVIDILAKERYEPANYPSVTIPTNIDLAEGSAPHFGRFYAALFDRTLEKNPKAIVTEYSWNASSCDPCPGPTLGYEDFATLGADALPDATPGNPTAIVDDVKGTASPASTGMVPKRFLPRVLACWSEAQSREPKPKPGRIDVEVTWEADGKVKRAAIAADEPKDKALSGCIEKLFASGMMPREPGSLTIGYALGIGSRPAYRPWTLTRLHARYTKESLGEDIVFKAAPPIVGGREVRGANDELEHGATSASTNNFQGRYAIRHPWVGPVACAEPRRGVWGGPWPELGLGYAPEVSPAPRAAFVPRGGVQLTDFVRSDVSEIGVAAGKGPVPAHLAAASSAVMPSSTGAVAPPADEPAVKKGGCGGCSSTGGAPAPLAWLVALGAAAVTVARRRTTSR